MSLDKAIESIPKSKWKRRACLFEESMGSRPLLNQGTDEVCQKDNERKT